VVTIKLYDTQENAYLDLTSGRLDAMLADKYAIYDWLKEQRRLRPTSSKMIRFNEDDKSALPLRKGDPLREQA
jgi:putative lysine/arginine/ornithine/histidine/octopine transport system substrate-binding protein